jgi:hypothetical protein
MTKGRERKLSCLFRGRANGGDRDAVNIDFREVRFLSSEPSILFRGTQAVRGLAVNQRRPQGT